MGKPGVMFYFNMRPSAKLSDAERLQLYDAILDYAQTGTAPKLSGALGIVWEYIQPTLDEDNKKYEATKEKRAKAGALGGSAKAKNAKQDVANSANAGDAKQETANSANLANSIQLNTVELNSYIGGKPSKVFPPTEKKKGKEKTGEPPLVGGGPPARFYYDPILKKAIDREEARE